MATWKQIKDYIRGKYQVQPDEDELFQMTFETTNGRSQLLFVQKDKTESNNTWVSIYSPVGLIEDDDLNDVLEYLDGKICGGLVKIGEKHFVRQNSLVDDLSPDQFSSIVDIIVGTADEIEEKFVGGDEN